MLPIFLLSLFIPSLVSAVRLQIDSQSLSTRSPPSTAPPTLPPVFSLEGDDDCFNASADSRLIEPKMDDCLQAVQRVRQVGTLTRPLIFSRRARGIFPLPQVFRSGTCVISVDVVHDADSDIFPLLVVNNAALDLAMECVGGSSHVGGKKFIGPRQVVYVMVFGRNPPPTSAGGGFIQLVTNVTNNVTLELA